MGLRIRPRRLFLPVLVVLGLAGPAAAASWGGITPGETTRREVEAQYGRPTRERTVVEEGRTVPEWTYSGDRLPKGVSRLVLNFGLMGPGGFTLDVVRAIQLFPEPRVFTVTALGNGWGDPIVTGTDTTTGRRVLRYAGGLLVVLDKTEGWAEFMLFAPLPKP